MREQKVQLDCRLSLRVGLVLKEPVNGGALRSHVLHLLAQTPRPTRVESSWGPETLENCTKAAWACVRALAKHLYVVPRVREEGDSADYHQYQRWAIEAQGAEVSYPKSLGHLVAEQGSEPALGVPLSMPQESRLILEEEMSYSFFKA